MTVLLAKTQHGVSTFYAPMPRAATDGEILLNGTQIPHMESKLETRTCQLPNWC